MIIQSLMGFFYGSLEDKPIERNVDRGGLASEVSEGYLFDTLNEESMVHDQLGLKNHL